MYDSVGVIEKLRKIMSNLFDQPTTTLKAITINGAIVVESEEDKRKRAERRAQRKSRWDNTKANIALPPCSAAKKAKSRADGPISALGRNALTYVPESPIIRDNPEAWRERKAMLPATLDVTKTDERTQQIYVLRLQIQDCTTRLNRPDLGRYIL